MKKDASNYVEVYSYNKPTSNTNPVSQISVSNLTKLAEKERGEVKAKNLPKRKHFGK